MKKRAFFAFAFICQISIAQIVTIPDANFKAALIAKGVDTNGDGEIQVSEAENITSLNLGSKNISSLQGISSFTKLKSLNCQINKLSSIDLSKNVALTLLNLDGNKITSIDLSKNTALTNLQLYSNQLTSIDISKNTTLTYLSLSSNQLTSIDVSKNTALAHLRLSSNQLTSIDVSKNTALTHLHLNSNQLTSIDISKNTTLTYLSLSSNQLTSINISKNTALTSLDMSLNQLKSIDLSKNTALAHLHLYRNQLTSIDLSKNTVLDVLSCSRNKLTSIDLTQNTTLESLECSYNQLTSIDVTKNTALVSLDFEYNKITSIDLTQNTALIYLICPRNKLTYIDISKNPALDYFNVNNNELRSLFLKNGTKVRFTHRIGLYGNPNLKFICVDPDEQTQIQDLVNSLGYTNCAVNSFCTFTPGGTTYKVKGTVKVDVNKNGCDANDLRFPFLKLKVVDAQGNSGIYSTDAAGNYDFSLPKGTYSITYQFPYASYFNASPPSFSVNFPTDTSPFVQDICLVPNGTYNDLQVAMLPLDEARPGFDAKYKIVYANVGTTPLSGDVTLKFDDSVLDFVSASTAPNTQNTGSLSWSFANLAPLEIKTINVVMNLNSPMETPPLNGGEILRYTASISPMSNDQNSKDNHFSLKQTVVNSFDPNDKTCLEGNVITPDLVGEYVHYLIRFENTGTASAVNVVVKDVIDTTKFDMTTFTPMDSSHSFVTKVVNNNEVRFIFEGIQLPFDDATNDGYVLFKIKTLPTLKVGDTFENKAEIYFDFNFPIITNVAKTNIDMPASVDDFALHSNIVVYPNPAESQLQIESKIAFDAVLIHDLRGREIKRVVSTESKLSQNMDVSSLKSGVYYLTIQSGNSKKTQKFLKR